MPVSLFIIFIEMSTLAFNLFLNFGLHVALYSTVLLNLVDEKATSELISKCKENSRQLNHIQKYIVVRVM